MTTAWIARQVSDGSKVLERRALDLVSRHVARWSNSA
jgi:hypothetical protein